MADSKNIDLGKYWDASIPYESYIEDIEKEIVKKDSFLNYYTLNLKRMARLQKKFDLNDNHLEQLNNIERQVDILIITEGWCGDAAQIIPVIKKMADASDKIKMRVIYRDENEALINAYLTNGGKSIPIVIGIDPTTKEEVFHWGPRPAFGNALLEKYKAGEMTKEYFLLDLQKAYNKDNGQTIANEILNKIK